MRTPTDGNIRSDISGQQRSNLALQSSFIIYKVRHSLDKRLIKPEVEAPPSHFYSCAHCVRIAGLKWKSKKKKQNKGFSAMWEVSTNPTHKQYHPTTKMC